MKNYQFYSQDNIGNNGLHPQFYTQQLKQNTHGNDAKYKKYSLSQLPFTEHSLNQSLQNEYPNAQHFQYDQRTDVNFSASQHQNSQEEYPNAQRFVPQKEITYFHFSELQPHNSQIQDMNLIGSDQNET